jgi:hypothetical protein
MSVGFRGMQRNLRLAKSLPPPQQKIPNYATELRYVTQQKFKKILTKFLYIYEKLTCLETSG